MKKSCRRDCGLIAKLSGLGKINANALNVTITFFPPDKRRRDLDNMLASLKSGLDGVSDVVGIDDSKWTITLSKAATVAPDGMVKLELNWVEKGAKAA
jgi:crossover junction endodeoxyribonuclease RusA